MENEIEKEYVQNLREEYTEHKRDELDELRDLDRKVKLPALIFAYAFGIIGALVLGLGMCLAMKVIGASLPLSLPVGIAIGCVGIAMVAANYFFYRTILVARKKKYAPKILAATDELLNR